MPAKHSYPTMELLAYLLQMIHNRDMALPDFQRDFVWDPAMTDELIESIVNNFPAGTLLRVKNGQELLFQPRAFQGAPILEGARPVYLILDGSTPRACGPSRGSASVDGPSAPRRGRCPASPH